MENKKRMRAFVVGIFALAGCSMPNSAGTNKDGGEMIAACDLQGSVTEFSDNGCTINPVTSDHDSEAVIAAEGYEDESAKVTVKYGDGCTFQRAVISIATGKAVASEAAKAEIKKKTSLLLYGDRKSTRLNSSHA